MVVATAALAVTGLALGWGWTSWRPQPDLLAQGTSAYLAGDFRQAADLARSRLKRLPDDTEALRLLARATARLGRDAPANALFARLGNDHLQAEDLYLLGLGLNRAGQKESAGRVWEKGLALDHDHAETIEQLMIRDIAQSRLAEASELAERLAQRPGWEFRGELRLGNLRAELGDPAGAATALRRALERPAAAGLDRPALIIYRELLARSLLKTARPGEARQILPSVLQDGDRPQTSWLLSRAALQEGAMPEAVATLKAAGSYRSLHPLELEPASFVGESQCTGCHQDKARAVQASRHSSTLVRGKALADLPYPNGPVPDPDDPAVTHQFHRDGDRIELETRIRDKVFKAVVDYAFGSPQQYFSLVGHVDQEGLSIFRLSHYQTAHDSGWVRTTGHTPDPRGEQNFLGKPLDPVDGLYKCLFCHTTDPRAVLSGTGAAADDRAIGCERCHGPGGNHLFAIAAGLADPAIVNPANAPAEGRLRVCGQCHSHHQESPLSRTDPFWLRFQGTTIAWSRCYTESAGSFDCMTCHDAHHDNDRTRATHNEQCLTCHSGELRKPAQSSAPAPALAGKPTTVGSPCPVNRKDGCIGCHMPAIEIKPLHATFTDHYIRVHPDSRPVASP
jgi:tetratricopeptide (TPR) repeat protein